MSAINLRVRSNVPPNVPLYVASSFSFYPSISSSLLPFPLHTTSCRFAIVSSAEYTPLNKSIHEPVASPGPLPPLPFIVSVTVVIEIGFAFHAHRPVGRPVPQSSPRAAFFIDRRRFRFREISSTDLATRQSYSHPINRRSRVFWRARRIIYAFTSALIRSRDDQLRSDATATATMRQP